MNYYTVAPNRDATGWYVKIEDVAPGEQYAHKDDAIQAADKLAADNKPSTLRVLDDEHGVEEERTFVD